MPRYITHTAKTVLHDNNIYCSRARVVCSTIILSSSFAFGSHFLFPNRLSPAGNRRNVIVIIYLVSTLSKSNSSSYSVVVFDTAREYKDSDDRLSPRSRYCHCFSFRFFRLVFQISNGFVRYVNRLKA